MFFFSSAQCVLSSYLKRKGFEVKSADNRSKRPKVVQSWDRDIICLPQEPDLSTQMPFPRGKYRASLGMRGLISKIRLTSAMTVEDVEDEVRSVFEKPMCGRKDFHLSAIRYCCSTDGSSSKLKT